MDLKTLGRQLGAGNLSFASEDRLEKYLGLKQGSVSPFGLMNDTEHAVEFGCGCYEDSVIEQCEYSKWENGMKKNINMRKMKWFVIGVVMLCLLSGVLWESLLQRTL